MASILPVASPVPQPYAPNRRTQDVDNLQPHYDGRSTPLPQYEKSNAVPFTLTLQEEKDNPGQFQLVVNIDSQQQKLETGSTPRSTPSKRLIASLKEVPSLGYDVSQLYHTRESSPPTSPQDDKQGWADLNAIPPEFLNKVVPDWKITFSRSDSTTSVQSRKLADIKARIKKSGKGFVVRLLKGSTSDPNTNEVAEVDLGSGINIRERGVFKTDRQELAAETLPVELAASFPSDPNGNSLGAPVEIGSSSEPGIPRSVLLPSETATRSPAINKWLGQVTGSSRRTSILEEGLSDAETLLPEVPSIADRLDDTDVEPFSSNSSVILGRTNSTLSIVKTPTRGLSVVGPVRRVQKASRARGKGKAARSNLNRSGANKSFKRSMSNNQIAGSGTMEGVQECPSELDDGNDAVALPPDNDITQAHEVPERRSVSTRSSTKRAVHRSSSAKEAIQEEQPKSRLRLETNVPRAYSANTSPVTKRKRKPRMKRATPTSSNERLGQMQHAEDVSPVWSEVDPSDEMRAFLNKAFGAVDDSTDKVDHVLETPADESIANDEIYGILPPDIETRLSPPPKKNLTSIFFNLAFTALIDGAFEGLTSLRNKYGSEPPVAPNHVRVRWTCSCGESLYDDFIENKPGAARDLEWYLNRPRSHASSDPPSKSSTFNSMGSLFDANSRASTLTTPASTYAGNPWGKQGESSRYSPTRLRHSPFSVHIGASAPESWLLTCANEGRFTPKIVHVDVNKHRIRDDRALFIAIRDHYQRLNKGWFSWARLRGLSKIEFAQFEVHRNRFADIRAAPSMPPISSVSSEKAPSQHPYNFEPHDLLPPVGSAYLMHLFMHPEDYEGETMTYERSPKRRERLDSGMGWGISLVEGFQAPKVWAVIMMGFGIGSAVFAAFWTIRKGDMQGAFGVASWLVTFAGLGVAGLQACLD
ncbi:unnamed protein product [Periconia digitata]|uniref:Uncharacterized protein n=1 Tax=Periconia digitata TaxID=1303443 RepID=A0A9W4XXI4_9PLEO|nr:unnamed protein product [Periconia digitata]